MDSLKRVCVERAPHRLEEAHGELFNQGALGFLAELLAEFDDDVEKVSRVLSGGLCLITESLWSSILSR